MFQDSLIAVMAMMLLCFSGMLLMFVFMVRAITALADAQKESFHRQQLYLAQLEQQCIDLKAMLQSSMNKTPAAEQDAAHSSRLLRAQDPLESMLEETASKFDGMASHSENAGLSFMPELSFGPEESGGLSFSGPSVRAAVVPDKPEGRAPLPENDTDPLESSAFSPRLRVQEADAFSTTGEERTLFGEKIEPEPEDSESAIGREREDRANVPLAQPEAAYSAFNASDRQILAGFGSRGIGERAAGIDDDAGPLEILRADEAYFTDQRQRPDGSPDEREFSRASSFDDEESWLRMVDPHSSQRSESQGMQSGGTGERIPEGSDEPDYSPAARPGEARRQKDDQDEHQVFGAQTGEEADKAEEEESSAERTLREHIDKVLQQAENVVAAAGKSAHMLTCADRTEYKADAFAGKSGYDDESSGNADADSDVADGRKQTDLGNVKHFPLQPEPESGTALETYASRFMSDREDPFHTNKGKPRDKKVKGKKKLAIRRGAFSVDRDD